MLIQTKIIKEVLIIPAMPNFRQVRVFREISGTIDYSGQSTSKIEAGETKHINMALVHSMEKKVLNSNTYQHQRSHRGEWCANIDRVLKTHSSVEVIRIEFIPTLNLDGLYVQFVD